MEIADLPAMVYLETPNFTAFLRWSKLVSPPSEKIKNEIFRFPKTPDIIDSTLRHSGYVSIISGPSETNLNFIDDIGIKTENTASNENSKNTTIQKPAFPNDETNYQPKTDDDHKGHEEPQKTPQTSINGEKNHCI